MLVYLMYIILAHVGRTRSCIGGICHWVPHTANLVVGQEESLVETLVLAVALFDVAKVPFRIKGVA